jgi:microcin C transport system substrate-binding protein
MGVKNPAVDAMVNNVIYAKDRQHLVTAAHALDRVLLWGDYLVPNWYIATYRAAYWNRFSYPKTIPLYYDVNSWLLATWWQDGHGKKGQ